MTQIKIRFNQIIHKITKRIAILQIQIFLTIKNTRKN